MKGTVIPCSLQGSPAASKLNRFCLRCTLIAFCSGLCVAGVALPAVKKELANAGSVCRTSGARDFLFATVTQPLRTGLTCDAPNGALETESAPVKAQSKQEAVAASPLRLSIDGRSDLRPQRRRWRGELAATNPHALEAVARDALKRSPYRGGTCYENSTAAASENRLFRVLMGARSPQIATTSVPILCHSPVL
jgi:hypothetical protein